MSRIRSTPGRRVGTTMVERSTSFPPSTSPTAGVRVGTHLPAPRHGFAHLSSLRRRSAPGGARARPGQAKAARSARRSSTTRYVSSLEGKAAPLVWTRCRGGRRRRQMRALRPRFVDGRYSACQSSGCRRRVSLGETTAWGGLAIHRRPRTRRALLAVENPGTARSPVDYSGVGAVTLCDQSVGHSFPARHGTRVKRPRRR